MCESLRSFHMKHSGTGSPTRREACPNGAEQTMSQMVPHVSTQNRFSSGQSTQMLPDATSLLLHLRRLLNRNVVCDGGVGQYRDAIGHA